MTIATLLIALIATPAGDATGEREPLLLDFHASWCGPCQQMRPAIKQLVELGYQVKSVDVDRSPELAQRYEVSAVPTFVIVDAAGEPLARTKGVQPAGQLARMYRTAKAKLQSPAAGDDRSPPASDRDRDRDRDADSDTGSASGSRPAPAEDKADDSDLDRPARTSSNPKPWETVVRIKVKGQGSIGFGSGTIIASTAEESIVLTCAHIFKLEGRQQAPPAKFPREIAIDLFDGHLSGQQPAMVHYANETYPGKAIDYDFGRDVGLIRIRPGRKLPYSRVVPAHWKPKERMLMTTVGCSEGRDATAWSTTIVNPSMRGLSGNPLYEAIECIYAPKQGRSGGGLYTSDGYIAGVCDFAEPRGNHGLYATPTSIYQILDKNNLSVCYAPVRGPAQTLLTSERSGSGSGGTVRRPSDPPRLRTQSPDRDESNLVMIPPPELLGIRTPAGEEPAPRRRAAGAASDGDARRGWRPTPTPELASQPAGSQERTERTDLTLGPEFDNDRFASIPTAPEADSGSGSASPVRPRPQSGGTWRPVRAAMPALK
jgi:thiol-disulfide isomerase/thioredoxin